MDMVIITMVMAVIIIIMIVNAAFNLYNTYTHHTLSLSSYIHRSHGTSVPARLLVGYVQEVSQKRKVLKILSNYLSKSTKHSADSSNVDEMR